MPTFTTPDATTLFYEDQGTGQPVLCLPGLTRNSADFQFLAPHLGDVRLIRLDFRGRGKSDYPDDYTTYNVTHEAQDVIALLDHLGLDRASIIGTSRGGLVSMVLAATHPERLAAVVLNDIGPVIDTSGLERIMDYVGKEPGAPDMAIATERLQKAHAHEFPGVPMDRWRAQAEAMWFEKPESGVGIRYDSRLHTALVEQAAAGPAPDLWPLFECLRDTPTGVIRGANSDLLTADTVSEMHARHPGLKSVSVPDRGHVPFLDEPEALSLICTILDAAT